MTEPAHRRIPRHRGVAEFSSRAAWEDCPPEAVEARRAISIASASDAGARGAPARIIQRIAEMEGGTPLATVVGTGRRTGAGMGRARQRTAAMRSTTTTPTSP
jgi:2-methylcitrate dehydratase PrpD